MKNKKTMYFDVVHVFSFRSDSDKKKKLLGVFGWLNCLLNSRLKSMIFMLGSCAGNISKRQTPLK